MRVAVAVHHVVPDTGLGDHTELLVRVFDRLGHQATPVRPPLGDAFDLCLFQWVPHLWGRGGIAPMAATWPLRLRVPVVAFVHELYEDPSDLRARGRSLIQRAELWAVLRGSGACITTNEAYARRLREHHGVTAHVIPAGSILEGEQPAAGRFAALEAILPQAVLWFGTWAADDRLDLVAQAVQRLERPLILAGKVPPAKARALSDLLSAFPIEAHVLGGVTRAEAAWLFDRCGVYAFSLGSGPSGRRTTFASALVRGAPIVALDGPQAVGYVRDHGVCPLVASDADAFANALKGVLEDRSAWIACSRRAASHWCGSAAIARGLAEVLAG